ncbi:hypothetical protein RclHR1_01720022 [Rhizophagus clarus]|nr:hypothetical protein RclHR1_01720022 [Rhizophagus clarus]
MNWHPSTLTLSPPPIQLPFPPPITAQDIVLKRPTSKICSKSPNAFFIYRKVYFDQLALLNQRFKMTDVSKLVSLYWNNECREVKEAYKKIAQEVESELNERRKRDLVYPEINSNFKIARRRNKNNNHNNNNISKKKCGKLTTTTHNRNESTRGVVNQQSGAHFELTFGSDMQPLIHSYNDADFENVLMSNCTLSDTFSSSSDEPTIFTVVTKNNNSETILDQSDVNDYAQDGYELYDDDDVLDPIPAQSVNNQSPVENNDNNSDLLNVQNVAFEEFCFDDNTNLNWYLQNFF